jgi:hypothetical protein
MALLVPMWAKALVTKSLDSSNAYTMPEKFALSYIQRAVRLQAMALGPPGVPRRPLSVERQQREAVPNSPPPRLRGDAAEKNRRRRWLRATTDDPKGPPIRPKKTSKDGTMRAKRSPDCAINREVIKRQLGSGLGGQASRIGGGHPLPSTYLGHVLPRVSVENVLKCSAVLTFSWGPKLVIKKYKKEACVGSKKP